MGKLVEMTNPEKTYDEMLSGLARVDSGAGYSYLNPEYTAQDIQLSITPGNLLSVLHKAREARDHGYSWRGFKVGAAVFAMTQSPSGYQIVTGANYKPSEESDVNVHAEQLATQRAREFGHNIISIIGVVGETQLDQQSGHATHTLHPCGKCRHALGSSPLVHPEHTLIASALPDFRTIELSTISRLTQYHDEAAFDTVTRLEIPKLSILEPLMMGGVVHPTDDQAIRDEEHAWDAAMEPHLEVFRRKRAA
ncbi:hypothetical protein BGO17_00865 [Candidatus Saccharibacteria bacterium 49-20]|nr:MAG: hypothetical protein BGO17_00865 [Candidatus Saccharibacteria bacterium 49-20]